jgi:hypothetical protein
LAKVSPYQIGPALFATQPKGEVTMKNIWAVMKTADLDTGC